MFSRRVVVAALALVLVAPLSDAADMGNQVPVPPPWIAHSPAGAKAYQDSVKRRALKQKEDALAQLFPKTDVGRALLMTAVLVPHGLRPYNAVEFAIVGRQLAYLNAHAPAALAAIDRALQSMPQRYFAEQQFLIQFGSRLAAPRTDVMAFLGRQMRNPARLGPSGKPDASFYTSAVALSSLLRLTSDTAAIEKVLVPAIRAKTDVLEQQALLAQYHAVSPTRAELLSTRLKVINSP